ncbi:MAG: hypothetical protein H7281_12450 [Bacteriovorax sp.]|nr:hypothetical protein [Bacteriovorax sp.]
MTKSLVFFFILILSAKVFADFDETQIQTPLKDSDEEILNGSICRTRDHGHWDVCYSLDANDVELMRSFKFSNFGGNKTVPMSGFGISRDFEFSFEGLARSDMNLLVWDAPDEIESHAHLKILYFFPRTVLPAIHFDESNSALIVTLPTKEEVIFDAKTREVMSGALTEGILKQTSSGTAVAPNIQYAGSGVVVEADAVANWPVGFDGANAGKTVSIKKKGQKVCNIPGKELFYTDDNKGGNVFLNKKYITDAAFDVFVKKRCGFSIF